MQNFGTTSWIEKKKDFGSTAQLFCRCLQSLVSASSNAVSLRIQLVTKSSRVCRRGVEGFQIPSTSLELIPWEVKHAMITSVGDRRCAFTLTSM